MPISPGGDSARKLFCLKKISLNWKLENWKSAISTALVLGCMMVLVATRLGVGVGLPGMPNRVILTPIMDSNLLAMLPRESP